MLKTLAALLAVGLACGCVSAPSEAPSQVQRFSLAQADDAYFQAGAARASQAPEPQRARNLIVFIGDGMGVSTVTAARIFAGQREGLDGESHEIALDRFPHTALARTYSHDFQVSDSAATATALMSGVKTRSGVLNLTAAAPARRCGSSRGAETTTLFALAEAAGLATGIVSTARLTHATPAAAFASAASRNWEADVDVPLVEDGPPCLDIARQLLEWPAGDGFEVALGGGRANFLPQTHADPEHPEINGRRGDGRDLTLEWAARGPQRRYVWNREGFEAAAFDSDVQVLGLFSPSHMAYEAHRSADPAGEPSLREMTAAAITRLARSQAGYLLMVEGGRIDHGHHEGRAYLALSDAAALDEAVSAALEMTSREDTLILVTADHSHTLAIAGYARRGNPILGLAASEAGPLRAGDGLPYTTLGYLNGPGSVVPFMAPGRPRPDLTQTDTLAPDFRQQSLVPMGDETHGGEDVIVYAWGPGDSQFAGTIEQNVIFHLAARALGWRVD